MQAAEEPYRDENDQNQAESATQSGSTIPAVPIVTASAAQQQNQHDDDQDCAHFTFSLKSPTIDRLKSGLDSDVANQN